MPLSLLATYGTYLRGLLYFLRTGGDFAGCPFLQSDAELPTKVHLYGLYLDLFLWDRPHYRAKTYRHDLLANLRNVAVPGTGVALSFFCWAKSLAYLFIFCLYPLLALAGAFNVARHELRATRSVRRAYGALCAAYKEHLLAPEDWFTFWRLNSRIAAYHELLTHSPGYKQEDKWTFLVDGDRLGVPVTPVIKADSIVVKNKNEEGGLGIYFYKNALAGGDWIIQERLDNAPFLKDNLLPPDAPLSTLRVITASRGGLTPQDPRQGRSADDRGFDTVEASFIEALSCVFRAGRKGASTDHSSILFDVDIDSGLIKEGSTNAHWYALGPRAPLATPWRSAYATNVHPDAPDRRVAGLKIHPDMAALKRLVCRAHYLLLPDVPFVGWDVALTSKGTYLLEVNLSCNFFRGSFDKPKYFAFCRDYLLFLQAQRQQQQQQQGGRGEGTNGASKKTK